MTTLMALEMEVSALLVSNKILAFDQSSHITGYAVFKDSKLVAFNKFNMKDIDLNVRLMKIRLKVQELIDTYVPDKVILEDIQLQSNVTNNVVTYKALAQVQGVIIELLTELHIPYELVLASSWKSTLGIKGKSRADQKRNAQQYVQNQYNIKCTQDECDAICIGEHYVSLNTNNWS